MATSYPTTVKTTIRPITSIAAPPASSPEWGEAEQFGHYKVLPEQDSFRIFPRNRQGEVVPVTITRNYLHLRDSRSGATVTLKRYKHQGRWHYGDSREKASISRQAIVNEVARLLFGGDAQQAVTMVGRHLG